MSATTEDRVLGASHVSGALAEGEAEIELRGVSKRFSARNRETLALTDIDLGIRKQEFVTLLGQSGCGKTTLLRILAGLIAAERRRGDDQRPPALARRPPRRRGAAQARPRLPGREPVPLVHGRGEHRAAAAAAQGRQGRAPAPGARAGRARRPAGVREGAPARALRRHAPARRHRPGPELRPRDPAHGRAVRGARRDHARQDEPRAAAARGGDARRRSSS